MSISPVLVPLLPLTGAAPFTGGMIIAAPSLAMKVLRPPGVPMTESAVNGPSPFVAGIDGSFAANVCLAPGVAVADSSVNSPAPLGMVASVFGENECLLPGVAVTDWEVVCVIDIHHTITKVSVLPGASVVAVKVSSLVAPV